MPSAKPRKTRSLANKIGLGFLIAVSASVGVVTLFMTVIEPRRAVAQVRMSDGSIQKVNTIEFQKRLHFERARQVQAHQKANAKLPPSERTKMNERPLYTLGFAGGVLERMTHEILIREAAARRKLGVAEQEIDLLIEKIRLAPSAPAPEIAASAAAAKVSSTAAASTKISATDLLESDRDIIRTEILEKKLRTAFFEDIPVEQDRVQLKLIRFELEAQSRQTADALAGGNAFAELYDRVMAGVVDSASGMIRDWSSPSELERDFNRALSQTAFRLAIGEHFPQPVAATHGWYLVQVTGREMRTMPEAWRQQRGEDAFTTWLEQQHVRVTQFPIWMDRVPTKWLPPDLPETLIPSAPQGQPRQSPGKPVSRDHPLTRRANTRPDLGKSPLPGPSDSHSKARASLPDSRK